MGSLIRAYRWASSPLGGAAEWPIELKTLVSLLLISPQPMFIAWGADRTWLYNDGFTPILGDKHPRALGRPAMEVWAEAKNALEPMFARVFAGEPFYMDDFSLDLERNGRLAEAHFSFSYTPVRDQKGAVGGLFGACIETTASVVNARLLAESEERLQIALSAGKSVGTWDWDVPNDRVFADAGFATLYGVDPDHAKAGAPIAEFFGGIHSDDVRRVQAEVANGMETGKPFVSECRLPQPNNEERWVVAQGRCVLSADGKPLRFSGLSFDITERKNAEIRREALVGLTDYIRDLDNPEDLAFAASTILGETLRVSRVSYGTIDPDAETLTVDRDWLAPGVESLAGTLKLRDYGSFIDSLKRGEFIAIADVDQDERTASAAEALKNRSAGAFVNVPVIEQGRLVAVLFLNNAKSRQWASEDLALVREIAERTRTATERLKAVAALRQANANLEAKVKERTAELVAAAEALRQSQKMEAVGQLTGGIAHDFNNLLAGISGSLELLDKRLSQGRLEGVSRYINVAQESARRAASLTQRLLAFARRQNSRSQDRRREPHDRGHGRLAAAVGGSRRPRRGRSGRRSLGHQTGSFAAGERHPQSLHQCPRCHGAQWRSDNDRKRQ